MGCSLVIAIILHSYIPLKRVKGGFFMNFEYENRLKIVVALGYENE